MLAVVPGRRRRDLNARVPNDNNNIIYVFECLFVFVCANTALDSDDDDDDDNGEGIMRATFFLFWVSDFASISRDHDNGTRRRIILTTFDRMFAPGRSRRG